MIYRLQHAAPGLGQWLTSRIISRAQQLAELEVRVDIDWVPRHMSVEGNEMIDEIASLAA